MANTRLADSAILLASCVHLCATGVPNGNGALHGVGDAEHAQDNARRHANMEFSATDD